MFRENPVIAAVKSPKDIYEAVESKTDIIFLLGGNIFNLSNLVDYVRQSGKHVFVHLDLLKGYVPDNYFLKYLKEEIKPTGVITTKNSLVTKAKHEGLLTIQRLFLLDTSAMDVTIQSAKKIKPDAVEVLPGLVPKITKKINEELNLPIITGGLIETEEEVKMCLDSGALACSSSNKQLWKHIENLRAYSNTTKK